MAYIGNSPLPSGNFSASSHNGGTAGPFAMGQSPGTENAVLAFIDGVRQDPLNYSISGSNLTFNSATPSGCLLYTSPSPRDRQKSRMPSSA